ncbi:hypothetical protein GGS23DRAFT_597317 [Durotheca rogersii]|uniref:uncharacterized protein n=1 Tax=Durotheca rogersii TaxID=419775 RepID=UPI002220E562|nr:uncharacterized protein GGS23DRAFT_597317 [Durotheca rogersii]KAI5862512.1 hypothetical protein GGS23DRAFT_597317 [Durotheca rogersii]
MSIGPQQRGAKVLLDRLLAPAHLPLNIFTYQIATTYFSKLPTKIEWRNCLRGYHVYSKHWYHGTLYNVELSWSEEAVALINAPCLSALFLASIQHQQAQLSASSISSQLRRKLAHITLIPENPFSVTPRQSSPNMMFIRLAAVAVAAFLTAPALACKCFVDGGQDDARTQSCCGELNGITAGDDCRANSISEHLSDFRSCCGGQSDCDF